jgi:hypothetical protein
MPEALEGVFDSGRTSSGLEVGPKQERLAKSPDFMLTHDATISVAGSRFAHLIFTFLLKPLNYKETLEKKILGRSYHRRHPIEGGQLLSESLLVLSLEYLIGC